MHMQLTADRLEPGDQVYFNGRLGGTVDSVDTYEDLQRDFINTREGGSWLVSWGDGESWQRIRPLISVNREA